MGNDEEIQLLQELVADALTMAEQVLKDVEDPGKAEAHRFSLKELDDRLNAYYGAIENG